MIFDAHMHIGNYPLFNVSLDRDGLAATLEENGIDRCLVFAPDNAEVKRVVDTIPGAKALVWANPRVPGNIEDAIERLDDPTFVGVKLHPLLDAYHPNDPSLHPLMEVVAERRLPILVHCGHEIFTLPWSIEELAVSFPDAKVIFGHMGLGNVIYINACIDIACRRDNVYLETSGMPEHAKIAEAIEKVGETRVLYGSDAPFHHPAVEILKVRVSGLPDELVDRVLYHNALELFRMSDEPAEAASAVQAGG
jgi:predicted TIM-barrel fold metal-dependent hydrolase